MLAEIQEAYLLRKIARAVKDRQEIKERAKKLLHSINEEKRKTEMNTADMRFTIEQIENRLNGVQCMAGAVSDAMQNSPNCAENYSDAVWLIGELLRESQKELGKVLDSLIEMQQEAER